MEHCVIPHGETMADSEGSVSKEAGPFRRCNTMNFFPPLCPQCQSYEVAPVWVYLSSDSNLGGITTPLWVCQNPQCLHQWLREAAA
jgi:hypothetical protein